jgi:hypothetical protein
LSLGLLAAGCAADAASEHTGRVSAAVSVGALTPVPCKNATSSSPGTKIWDGTIADLLFADALVSCAAKTMPDESNPDGTFWAVLNTTNTGDLYTQQVVSNMNKTIAQLPDWARTSHEEAWFGLRTDPKTTCDQVTLDKVLESVTLTRHIVKESISDAPYGGPGQAQEAIIQVANNDLRTAGLNLCIAQQLRTLIPGSAGGESLLFPAAEQRQLLEVIRERSQMAMLQYALLGEVFAANTTIANEQAVDQTTGYLNDWANKYSGGLLKGMGNDFATAVQLNHTVAQEMVELLSRSRSSDASATPPNGSLADRYWGQASWQQRLMSFAFGGDPLAVDPNGPWAQAAGSALPGTTTGTDWPNIFHAPYVTTLVESPQVKELYLLAKRFDVIDLQLVYNSSAHIFEHVDTAATASGIYNAVESKLRFADCYPFNPNPTPTGTCPSAPPTSVSPPYLLQTLHGITLDDAQTLASLLADEGVGFTVTAPLTLADPFAYLSGALDVTGRDDAHGTVTQNGLVLHVSSQAGYVPRSLAETAGAFAHAAPLRLPTTSEIDPEVDAGSLGLSGACDFNDTCTGSPLDNNASESKRILGALAADVAVREMVLDALNTIHSTGLHADLLTSYLANAPKILDTIGGTAGNDGVRIVPAVQKVRTSNARSPYYDTEVPPPPFTDPEPQLWEVSVTHAADDPWWQNGTIRLSAVSAANAGNLAAHPEVTWNGVSLQTLIATSASSSVISSDATPQGNEVRTFFAPLPLFDGGILGSLAGENTFSFVLSKTVGASVTYRLVAGNVDLRFGAPHYGQYFAYDGTLGNWVGHQAQNNPENPSEPAYDGFDLPIHWVPPFSAQVLGGNAGDSIVGSYLSLASNAGSEASKAVQTALNDLLQVQQDAAQTQAAATKSDLDVNQASAALCGDNNTKNCDTRVDTVNISDLKVFDSNGVPSPLYPPPDQGSCQLAACDCPGPLCDNTYFTQHFVYQLTQPFFQSQALLAHAVAPTLASAVPPTFPDYAGGSLQQAFIQQWTAMRTPIDKLQDLQNEVAAFAAQADAAYAVLASVNAQIQDACNGDLFGGFISGLSFPAGFSWGPLIQASERCNTLQEQLAPAQSHVIATQLSAVASLGKAAQDFTTAAAAMVQTGAAVQTLAHQADQAKAKAALEADLAAQQQTSSFGIYRIYHDYDTWRAMALLVNARKYALAARRAIEARYVVDLSRLTQNEAFVASPSTWAGDIYTYDLSMPSAVGLAVGDQSASPNPGGVYVNQVSDYVSNLQGFVSGYAASRPTAVAEDELDVIALPGLAPGSPDSVCSTETATTGTCESPVNPLCGDIPGSGPGSCTDATPAGTGYAVSCCRAPSFTSPGNWSLHCPGPAGAGQWVPVPRHDAGSVMGGDVDNACANIGGPTHPDEARLEFTLDAWGRVNGSTASAPYSKRFNVRWTKLAVNFVGTGVKNCMAALDPAGCYASGFIPFNLSHTGPAWVTDYDERWHQLDVPIGQIEGGKGLAAEIWLDPLKNGWSTDFISAVARSEYELRPIGGGYTLDFPVAPEVVLSRIERVQILVGSTAWVKQQ